MAMLTRLILYPPDGKRFAMLVEGAEYDGKVLRFTDVKTRIATQTTLPFLLQQVEDSRLADVQYP